MCYSNSHYHAAKLFQIAPRLVLLLELRRVENTARVMRKLTDLYLKKKNN